MRKSLTSAERLKSKADFALVFNNADIKSTYPGAKLVARKNGFERNRFAVTLVRKFGNAVQRNYARRVLKEIYRNTKQDLPTGYDIIVVLYSGDYGYHEREQQFTKLVRRANFAETDI
ncbi:MAG: ribonuclease P protein component [Spirochaetes bacterium]|nr:MAG: ribonuclease P protein component [Spirochaetota bacterium]